jgi:hypothetical protein
MSLDSVPTNPSCPVIFNRLGLRRVLHAQAAKVTTTFPMKCLPLIVNAFTDDDTLSDSPAQRDRG